PAVYNAANEEAVEAFHAGKIGFLDIVDTIQAVLDVHETSDSGSAQTLTLETLAEAERWAREQAGNVIASRRR
ncbi:MAG: 1-deoxy-D-xylulose-5-phosphate reductoisomerase, partial [Leucobacter sp.]